MAQVTNPVPSEAALDALVALLNAGIAATYDGAGRRYDTFSQAAAAITALRKREKILREWEKMTAESRKIYDKLTLGDQWWVRRLKERLGQQAEAEKEVSKQTNPVPSKECPHGAYESEHEDGACPCFPGVVVNPVPSEAALDALVERIHKAQWGFDEEKRDQALLEAAAAITALRKREQDRREAKCNPQAEAEKP